ncbi:MAG: hypothetical protein ACRDK8_03725 [Solirubrobacteraceae bacterium]
MRRPPHLALVCALLCLLCGAGPALAAAGHHHAHHAASQVHHTTSATTSHTTTAASHAAAPGGKATTKNGLTVLNDCQNHGQLTRTYPVSWLRKALSMMSAGTSQYSNCSTVLHQALLHDLHGQGSGGSSGSGATTIIIIVAVVLVILAALLGVLALRRRRGGPPSVA